jgi:competence protein ComFC
MYQTFIKPLYADIKTFVLDTLFPISCLSCGEEGTFICADCKSTMKTLEHQRCIVCQKNTPFGQTHPQCQTPWGADALINFYDYHDEKVSKIIIAGKYNFIPMAYEILGQMIADQLSAHYPLLTTHYSLVPIPLHTTRQRWRGFNQAEVLCEAIGKELGLPISRALIRSKITKTQKDLKKDARQQNITNAFCIAPSPSEGRAGERLRIQGQSFLLVDDVTTTGATLQEAAKILKRHGAAKVICLTVARD